MARSLFDIACVGIRANSGWVRECGGQVGVDEVPSLENVVSLTCPSLRMAGLQ